MMKSTELSGQSKWGFRAYFFIVNKKTIKCVTPWLTRNQIMSLNLNYPRVFVCTQKKGRHANLFWEKRRRSLIEEWQWKKD